MKTGNRIKIKTRMETKAVQVLIVTEAKTRMTVTSMARMHREITNLARIHQEITSMGRMHREITSMGKMYLAITSSIANMGSMNAQMQGLGTDLALHL